jgi:hypothetical protein
LRGVDAGAGRGRKTRCCDGERVQRRTPGAPVPLLMLGGSALLVLLALSSL